MNIKSIFQSKLDPTQVSLTVESIAKTLSIVVTAFAVMKGVDATPLNEAIKNLSETAIVFVSASVATYHAGQTVYGIVRKFFVHGA